VAAFTGITVLFNYFFKMHLTPAGNMGKVTMANVIASYIYVAGWAVLSFVSGIKRFKSILFAALIYSCLPFLAMAGSLFAGNAPAVILMVIFYLGVPVQGVHSGLLFLQLPIFLLGYKMGNSIKI
jgi:hypothetical protein